VNKLNDFAAGPIYSVNGISTASSSHITLSSGTLTGAYLGLTAAEREELNKLESEQKEFLRQKRIALFKQMPAQFRQFVIDIITLQNFTKSMSELDASSELSSRIRELRSRDFPGVASYYQYHGVQTYDFNPALKLFDFASAEDLIEAHSVQSIEEALSTSTDSIKKHE
jgi:hypothetical protein